jgi:hypothetical protein
MRLDVLWRKRRAPPAPKRLKLFQYWDGETPPPDVARWIEGFRRDNPDFEHVLFSARSAHAFIGQRFGARAAAAFGACAVPAMQADLLRLFALVEHGGVYIDVDHQSRQPLRGLLAEGRPSLIYLWLGLLNNGLMVFPRPGDPFLKACLQLALENVEERRYSSALMATGPGVFNAVRALVDPASLREIQDSLDDPSGQAWNFSDLLEHARRLIDVDERLGASWGTITLMNPICASIWVGMDQPDYKTTRRHWTLWQGDIYRQSDSGQLIGVPDEALD